MFRSALLILTVMMAAFGPLSVKLRTDAGLGGEAMVLCTEFGAAAVTIGADGIPRPVPGKKLVHCPDCLPLPLPVTAAAGMAIPSRPDMPAQDMDVMAMTSRPVSRSVLSPAARGPPRES